MGSGPMRRADSKTVPRAMEALSSQDEASDRGLHLIVFGCESYGLIVEHEIERCDGHDRFAVGADRGWGEKRVFVSGD